MDYNIANFLDAAVSFLIAFYNSTFFLLVKVMLGVYLAVLVADIILLLLLRDIAWDIKVGAKGADIPLASKKKNQKHWNKIKEKLKSDNVSQYKVAIIEADAFVEEFLGKAGYGGENMAQKLEQAGERHLDEHREALLEVHKIRNRIIHETDFEIDRETAETAVKVYEDFLKYLDFLG